ncbi:MAG TPA: argininosuccinate synthase [Candidatus Saccharimonadales bacterium]|nr:argininosuccinate synthase [Candidatus Saccharimonadales bacterium]
MKKEFEYQKIATHEAKKGEFKKCLLLYSGGVDTSVMLKWIQEQYDCEVIALTVDIGQTTDDLKAIKQKALDLGAMEAVVYDAKDEFAERILSQAIKANADYQGGYALSDPMGRVMISEVAVKVAEEKGCEVIAHGCTGKGNDQVRFEGYITTLNPKLKTIAPVREWAMGRKEEIEYAIAHGIPVKQTVDAPYSYDENMWGNTAEGGEIEDPAEIAPLSKILQWCVEPAKAPDEPELLKIGFEKGVPVSLNGKKMKLAGIIAEANKTGGKHGAGFVHMIEDRLVGMKVCGIYENPGAAILIAAHKKLEMLVSTKQENEMKEFVDSKWAYLAYCAQWYDPTMSHLEAYIDDQNQKVTGVATIELFKGKITVVAVDSPYSMFESGLATFDDIGDFNPNASPGFIEIYNLPQKTAYNVFKSKKDGKNE